MDSKLKKIFLILFLYTGVIYSSGIKDKAFEIINNSFISPKIEIEKFDLEPSLKTKIEHDVKQRFYQDYIYIYKIFVKGKIEGYALIDNVLGKSMPITFMVIFNNDGSIQNSSILKYREPYGGAVTSEDWQSQFKGKSNNSSYEIGKDISTISGATISVNSVSTGIRKLTYLFNSIKSKL